MLPRWAEGRVEGRAGGGKVKAAEERAEWAEEEAESRAQPAAARRWRFARPQERQTRTGRPAGEEAHRKGDGTALAAAFSRTPQRSRPRSVRTVKCRRTGEAGGLVLARGGARLATTEKWVKHYITVATKPRDD